MTTFAIFFLGFTKNFASDEWAAPESSRSTKSFQKKPKGLAYKFFGTVILWDKMFSTVFGVIRIIYQNKRTRQTSSINCAFFSACFSFRLQIFEIWNCHFSCEFFLFQNLRVSLKLRFEKLLASCVIKICRVSADS